MKCENCEENDAFCRVSVTDLRGRRMDTVALCKDCVLEAQFGIYTQKDGTQAKVRLEV